MPSEQNPDTTPPVPAGDGSIDDPAARLEQELRSRGLLPASTEEPQTVPETDSDDSGSANPEDDTDVESGDEATDDEVTEDEPTDGEATGPTDD